MYIEVLTAVVITDLHRPAQLPRVGFVLFPDKKNQKSNQQRGFFAAQAFAANRADPRAAIILLRTRFPYASAKTCYAPTAAPSTMFCPLSPEA